MRHRIFYLVFVLFFCLLIPTFIPYTHAQTGLTAGDIAIIGTNFDDPDEFAFVLLTNIDAGTVINFTDNGWLAAGGFRAGEGTVTWTAATDYCAGSVITPGVGGMLFSASGDQILAYQETAGVPTFVYALNNEGAGVWQADATSSNTSALPTGLANSLTAVALSEIDNAVYTGVTTGTRAELLAAVGNTSNWTGSDTVRQTMPAGPFTVTDATPCGGGDTPPTVTTTTPANGATAVAPNATITINFSEAVNATANAFALECPAGSPVTFSSNPTLPGSGSSFVLTPASALPESTTCTLTVSAAQITDQDGTADPMAANHVFSFTTGSTSGVTRIHDIQGSGATSPLIGSSVTIEGLVVGDFQRITGNNRLSGFFVQEEGSDFDANSATSEGIFVYEGGTSLLNVSVGDLVRVTGTVNEYADRTVGGATQTQLSSASNLQRLSAGNAISPILVTPAEIVSGELEWYEGMFIQVNGALTVAQNYFLGRYGQMTLSANGRLFQPTNQYLPGSAEALALTTQNTRSMIILDDGLNSERCGDNPNPVPYLGGPPPAVIRAGDTVNNLTGVVDYGQINSGSTGSCSTLSTLFAGWYRLHPTTAPTFTAVNNRLSEPEAVGGAVKVAAFNVLNYFNTFTGCTTGVGGGTTDCRGADNATEFTRQRDKIIAAIYAINADVIGIMEIENDGYGAGSAIQDLVNGLNAVAGPGVYAFIHADSITGSTNVLGTDAIKVGLLYKPGSVTPLGTAVLNITAFTDPLNTGTPRSRPALAQTFATTTGERFTIVVNHLKSKGSCPTSGPDNDQGDGQGCWNATRTAGANYLVNTWLASDPTGSNDPDFLIVGDLNAYARENPITTIETAGYTNLINHFMGSSAYSYIFDGQSGYLDHALASDSLTPQVNRVTEWHINADEPAVIDYNTDFNPTGYYSNNAYRASDHDPVVVGLNLAPYSFDVVINEVDYDQPGTDNAEFIELKNVTNAPLSLNGYTLELVNGSNSTPYATVPLNGVTIPANGYYVLCAPNAQVTSCGAVGLPGNIQNDVEAITLRQNGVLIDSLSYEGHLPGYTETAAAPTDTAVMGQSLSRYSDGTDSNNNATDFSLRCITPGIANSSQTSNCTVEFTSNCTLSTGTPLAFGTTAPITIELTSLGDPAIACVRAMYFGYNHPNASLPLQTGGYWHIEADPPNAGANTTFTYDLTLPFNNPSHPRDKVCRWLEGAGAGYGWDCVAGEPADYTSTSITRREIDGFSDWAVGDDVGPTAVALESFTPQSTSWLTPLLAALLGGLLLTALRLKRR